MNVRFQFCLPFKLGFMLAREWAIGDRVRGNRASVMSEAPICRRSKREVECPYTDTNPGAWTCKPIELPAVQ